MPRRLVLLLLFIFLSTFLTVSTVRLYVPEPSIEDVTQEERLVGTGLFKSLGEMYLDSLEANPHSIEYHQKMQLLYPSIDPDIQRKVDNFYDSIATILQYESEYLYSIGFRYSKEGYHDSASFYYSQIEEQADSDRSYLEHSRGFAFMKMREYEKAEHHLKKAIETGPPSQGVYIHLAKLYHLTRQYDKLVELISQEGMADIIPTELQRVTYIKRGDYRAYFYSFMEMNFTGFIWEGVLAAALIALVWLGFLYRLSLFRKLNLFALLGFFIVGALFSTLCTLLYDFYNIGFGIEATGNYLKDFLFCVGGIGLVEESLKLLPLLVFLLPWRKKVREPITLLLLGSASAVGFAFMENLIYFDVYGLKSIFGRALTSSVLHMGLTALPLYGVQKALECKKKHLFSIFLRYFTLAILIHGLYDFFLSADKALQDFKLISIVIWILLILFYRTMIQNLLNLSPFFVQKRESRLLQGGYFLGYALYTIFLMQFVFMANRFGSSVTIVSLPGSIMVYSYLLLLLPILMGTMKLYKNYTPSLFMVSKRQRPPKAKTSRLKRTYAKQWRHFYREHEKLKLRSSHRGKRGLKGVWPTLLCAFLSLTFLYIAVGTSIEGHWGSFGVLLAGYVVYRIRLIIKRVHWSMYVDMAKERLSVRYNKKVIRDVAFRDIYYMHTYGHYKELLLFDSRLLLDRTLFEDFEIETFFLYFEGYLISREDEPVEFHVEEELPEFAIPTLLFQKSVDPCKRE